MVGPLLLLKMLHCKRMNRRNATSTEVSNPGSSRDFNVKKEVTYVDDDASYICRVCLKEGHISIFGYFEDLSEPLKTFGGIDVSPEDEYPKYLCQSCNALLEGAILFRKTAQDTEQMLKNSKQEDDVSNPDYTSGRDYEDLNSDEIDYNYDVDMTRVKTEKEKSEKPCNECNSEKKIQCKRCNLEFESMTQYTAHRLSDEHENMRHTCPVCNKSYTAMYIRKHMLLHNKSKTTYMCDICGKNFMIQGQFTRHRLTHFYDLPFKCKLCPYRGRFTESLKLHMRSHTGEKPYQCEVCPARFFVSKSNLNKHLLTHKGDFDFKCDQCQRGFYTKKNLELHFKVDHSGIKDHVCNICGKAFGYRKQMMKHQLKVHKREKLRSGRLPLYLQVERQQQLAD